MSEWISIKERLPEMERRVLIYDGTDIVFGFLVRYGLDEARFALECGKWTTQVTHWQETPEPPETYTTDGVIVYFNGLEMTPAYITSLLNRIEENIDKLVGV